MLPLAVQQTKEFLCVPVLNTGISRRLSGQGRDEETEGQFVSLICERREASHVSLFFLLFPPTPPPSSSKKKVICL